MANKESRKIYLTLEGDESKIKKLLLESDITILNWSVTPPIQGVPGATPPAEAPIQMPPASTKTLRDFSKSLTLTNNYERIACIAYHLIRTEQKSFFTAKEMRQGFETCGFKIPNHMPLALFDAKRKYRYIKSIGKDQWVLDTDGISLISGQLARGGG